MNRTRLKSAALRTLATGSLLASIPTIVSAQGVTYEINNNRSDDVYLYFDGTFSGPSIPANGTMIPGNGSTSFVITEVTSGRIGFSIGETLADSTLSGFNNPNATDYFKRFDKVELTVNNGGTGNVNLTATDFTAIPFQLTSSSTSNTTGYTSTYSAFANNVIQNSLQNSTPNQNGSAVVTGSSGFGVNTTPLNDVVRIIAPSTVVPNTLSPDPFLSFDNYVTSIKNNASPLNVKRTAAGVTADFTGGTINQGSGDAEFTGGSLETTTTTFGDLSLTIDAPRLESEAIYGAASVTNNPADPTALTQSGTTITGSDITLTGASLSGIDISDTTDQNTIEFMEALNIAIQDFYVGFNLGAWGSTEMNLPGYPASTELGTLTTEQLLALGEAEGSDLFFGNAQSNPDAYNLYASIVSAASENTVYGFPYSDFITKSGENPLITAPDGGTITINILTDGVIPEPGTYALLAGLGALAVIGLRRRR